MTPRTAKIDRDPRKEQTDEDPKVPELEGMKAEAKRRRRVLA